MTLDDAFQKLVEHGGSIHFVRARAEDPASQHVVLVNYRGKSRSHFTGLQPGNTTPGELIPHIVAAIEEQLTNEAKS